MREIGTGPGKILDRKSVVEGKSVDLGGRRIIKKKKKQSLFLIDRPRSRGDGGATTSLSGRSAVVRRVSRVSRTIDVGHCRAPRPVFFYKQKTAYEITR